MDRRFEIPLAAVLVLAGAGFLLQMCYMPLVVCSAVGAGWLYAFRLYAFARYRVRVPASLLLLAFAAIEVDALGNFFRMYGRKLGPLMYDEFAHAAVQALVAPVVVWLLREWLARRGHALPLGLTVFFAVTTIFSLSAFYEIIELWDELYFGGQRIWSPHDAPNDLRWDFYGIVAGALAAYLLLRRAPPRPLRRAA